jgi:LysR family transcriptional regulator, pca operon transcriptional activator
VVGADLDHCACGSSDPDVPEVTAEALREYELVLPTVSQRVGQELDHLLSLLGLPSASSLRSSSYGFIREMLHATDSISVMPRLMMVGELLRGTLRVVPLPLYRPRRPAGLILVCTSTSPRQRRSGSSYKQG